jgi:hypothetical protein
MQKNIILFLLFYASFDASLASSYSSSTGTPLSPTSMLRRLISFRPDWQQRLINDVPSLSSDLKSRIQTVRLPDGSVQVTGAFFVDPGTWGVVDSSVPEPIPWNFTVKIQAQNDGAYQLDIEYPQVSYIDAVLRRGPPSSVNNEPFVSGTSWRYFKKDYKALIRHLNSIMQVLDPRSGVYGE